MSEITKVTKNPGRVAAGKRLQEWHKRNRQNKADLEKQLLTTTSKQLDKEVDKEPAKELESTTTNGILLLISIIAVGYILYSKNTPTAKNEAQEEKPMSRFRQKYLAIK